MRKKGVFAPFPAERLKFYFARGNAKRRKVPFLLTFEQWWKLWQESGHWDQRGRRRDQFCMARFGDKGAYQEGNVKICPNYENYAERKPPSGEQHKWYGKSLLHSLTPEQRARQLAALIKRNKEPMSLETRAKMSATKIARHIAAGQQALRDYYLGG